MREDLLWKQNQLYPKGGNFTKKKIAIALALVMTIGLGPAALAAGYGDTAGHWAEEYINKWSLGSKPILQGEVAGVTFGPDNPMKATDLDIVLERVLGVERAEWTASPEVSREEAAKKIAEAFSVEAKASVADGEMFGDHADISSDYAGYVYALNDLGVMGDMGGNTFSPKSSLTRAQAVTIVYDMISEIIDADADAVLTTYPKAAVIRQGGVTLKNKVFNGDLVIGQGVADGNVVIEDSKINGRLVVYGGGENSVIIRNTSVAGIIGAKMTGQNANIKIEGSSVVESATIVDNARVIITGSLKELHIGADASVTLAGNGTVGKVIMEGRGSALTVGGSAKVDSATVAGSGIKITGSGTVAAVTVTKDVTGSTVVATAGTKVTNESGAAVVGSSGGTVVPAGGTGTTPAASTPRPSGGGGGGGNDNDDDRPSTVAVTGVTLSETSVVLAVGKTLTLTASVRPANASNKTVTWSSDKPAVASVSGGVLTAVSEGTAVITVRTANGKTATCTVTVERSSENVEVTGVTLNETSAVLTVGGTLTLTAAVSPANASNKTVTWLSDEPAVAAVSGGVVTAVSEGTAVITVTTANGKTASCVVTVNAATSEEPEVISISAIGGLTAPVIREEPDTTIDDTTQFTGTVTWSPNDNPFAGGEVYTATITLKAKTGYTLDGVAANFFKVEGAATTNSAGSGVVTAVFPETETESETGEAVVTLEVVGIAQDRVLTVTVGDNTTPNGKLTIANKTHTVEDGKLIVMAFLSVGIEVGADFVLEVDGVTYEGKITSVD